MLFCIYQICDAWSIDFTNLGLLTMHYLTPIFFICRGAFVVVRTLSRIRVPSYCTAVPLDCGAPTGYFDWNMIQQLALNGLESAALFGGAAAAMEYAYSKKWIGKFPN